MRLSTCTNTRVSRTRVAIIAGAATIACGGIALPAAATTTYGSLGNFDAVNDTGKEAHGFEIDLEGISVSDVTDVFGGVGRYFPPTVERYGAPTIAENAGHTGVVVTYEAQFNTTTQSWPVGTPVVTPGFSTGGESCWTGGGLGYGPGTPCDHFGVGTSKNPTSTTYKWLTETAPNSPILDGVTSSLPAVMQAVTPAPAPPPGQPAAPPKVQGVIQIQAPDGGNVWGVAEWVKIFTTEYDHPVALEDLVGRNGIVPQNPAETEVEWQLLQSEAGVPNDVLGADNQAGANAKSVLRRYEFYKYTGGYDGEGQALTDIAITGPGGNIGDFIGAQNVAANLNGVFNGPPVGAVPEASTWAMLLFGFVGIGFAGCWRAKSGGRLSMRTLSLRSTSR